MKQLALLMALVFVTGISSTFAADAPKDRGPEVIQFKMGVMTLPFPHRKHQEQLNGECYHCHGKSSSWKIANWGKEAAHTICIACHDLEERGPVECRQCHKK